MAHLHCQPVGISRGNPRFGTGYRYKKLIELAPSREAFAIEDWDAFSAVYRAGLEELGLEAIMGKLKRISEEAGGATPVLLCFEVSPDDCHRGLLSDWLREHGVEVRELRAGDLPQRPDAPQPSLFG